MKLFLAIAIAGTLLLIPNQQAFAGAISNAVDMCQGALPSFEGNLRKRPLAITNEGAAVSFVSCSLRVTGANGLDKVRLLVINRGAVAQDVDCTLVDGLADPVSAEGAFGPAVYQPQTISVGAAGGSKVLEWWATTLNAGGLPYHLPNLNCLLPPGVEMNALETL